MISLLSTMNFLAKADLN